MITPISRANKLAKTPKNGPKYSVQIGGRSFADPRAIRALVALMDQSAVNGGAAVHWGGPSGFAEISTAVHSILFEQDNKEWFERYNFVNDAGHTENGIYAIRALYNFDNLKIEDLLHFRSIKSKLTGHGESHLNPQGVFISNGPLGSGLAQAEGLAMGDRLLNNDRVTFCLVSDGASMEGEAKEVFASLPGLAKKGKVNPFVMLVSYNNTKLSGRIDADSFDILPTLNSLGTLGWNITHVNEGHDLEKVYGAINSATTAAKNNKNIPQAVIVHTVKGYGVKSTAESSSGGHGYPLKAFDGKVSEFINEIYSNETPAEFIEIAKKLSIKLEAAKKSEIKTEKVQEGVSRALIRAADAGFPVVSLSCDVMGSTGVKEFQKKYPDRSIDMGIAESNMIGTAIGYSKVGFIPVVDSFAQFGITKGNLPLIMASLSQAPIIGIFSHAGLQDAADGASHQATSYLSAISSIPHLQVIQCATSKEMEELLYMGVEKIAHDLAKTNSSDSLIFVLGRENYPTQLNDQKLHWGEAQILETGKDVTLVASGPMVVYALDAAKELKEKGISATVINNIFVNRIDIKNIGKAIKATGGRVVTVEDHQAVCGMGSMLVHELLNHGMELKIQTLGLKGNFGQSAYLVDELYSKNNIATSDIVKAAKKLID